MYPSGTGVDLYTYDPGTYLHLEFETPWYWALNGTAGVLASAAAVLMSIYGGVATTFRAASIAYVLGWHVRLFGRRIPL